MNIKTCLHEMLFKLFLCAKIIAFAMRGLKTCFKTAKKHSHQHLLVQSYDYLLLTDPPTCFVCN